MEHTQDLRNLLSQHYGSECIFRHPMVRSFLYTEGVQAFAEHAGNGAYWFLDIIATEPDIKAGMRKHGFVIIVLDVKDGKAELTVSRDYDSSKHKHIDSFFGRTFDFTDCPEGVWMFYLTDNTMLLPSEY